MSFDLEASLRRLKPQKRSAPLIRRSDSDLAFVKTPAPGPALLLDATVYIDTLQKRLPAEVKALLRLRQINHSSIALSELAYAFGRLDPVHPGTKGALAAVRAVIEAIPSHRVQAPSIRTTIDAGIVTGSAARLRGLADADRQRLLNDATLFLQALEGGFWLLTRNIGDFDIMQQLVPSGQVLFYRQA